MDINCTFSVRLTGEGRATVGRYYVPEREMLQGEGRALFGALLSPVYLRVDAVAYSFLRIK